MSDWIKCSDRLPEHIKGDYLIVCEGGEIAMSEWIEDGGPGGEWGFWYDWDATHWQLLPAPPNE